MAAVLAGDVFDHHQRFPEVLRLSMWAQLERPEATAEPGDAYRNKALAVAAAAARPLTAVDILGFRLKSFRARRG